MKNTVYKSRERGRIRGLIPNLAVKIINQCYDITPNSSSTAMSSTIQPPGLLHCHCPPFGGSEMRAYILYLKDLRCSRLELKDQEERARLLSIQTKCEQWKAASARYYGKHPEVKERKRVVMAEKRAAKKLAKRRWDPPKPPKSTPDVELDVATSASAPSSENEVQAHEEAAAAASLLFLQQSTQRNPFPPDLPDSDDPVQPILKRHLLVVREEGEAGVSVKEGKSDGSDND
ncbi:hypothetical protein B0H13DRAFT_1912865 [Mycena leptocephala]|nr:hypothetical protein B0H13DRAFT_1912865 [Mycena leptocephala]